MTPPLHRPRRQWHVVPGVGHVLQAERAQPVAEAMARILARIMARFLARRLITA